MWAPPVISWFISPMNTIVISTINHSYWSYKRTNLAIVYGGPTLYFFKNHQIFLEKITARIIQLTRKNHT